MMSQINGRILFLDVQAMAIDMLSASAHKFNGPKDNSDQDAVDVANALIKLIRV